MSNQMSGEGERKTVQDVQVLPIYVEDLAVTRRLVETGRVRASRITRTLEKVVEEQLTHQHVEVHRIPMNLAVSAVPPVRQEGDTTIISVVEEVAVVERRLVLKEEIHFRRVKKVESYVETVSLREQTVVVTRTGIHANGEAEVTPSPNSNLKEIL